MFSGIARGCYLCLIKLCRQEPNSEHRYDIVVVRPDRMMDFQAASICHHAEDMTRVMANLGGRVRNARVARGITQLELARRSSISPQAPGAIESGFYQPSVMVALSLARELGETVETLFADDEQQCTTIDVPWSNQEVTLAGNSPCKAALARVAGKIIAVPQPAARLWLSPVAGIVDHVGRKGAAISTYWSQAEIDSTLLIAGCDPAVTLLADWLARRRSSVTAVALRCSSSKALAMLAKGGVHVASVHLCDPKSGEYNLRACQKISKTS